MVAGGGGRLGEHARVSGSAFPLSGSRFRVFFFGFPSQGFGCAWASARGFLEAGLGFPFSVFGSRVPLPSEERTP